MPEVFFYDKTEKEYLCFRHAVRAVLSTGAVHEIFAKSDQQDDEYDMRDLSCKECYRERELY